MAMPTIAPYYGLFITANLSIETVNTILTKANEEYKMYTKLSDAEQLFGNCWALVESRNQTVFQKPTRGPLETYRSDFLNASIDEIGDFVDKNFGNANGSMGKGPDNPYSYLANEVFAVLDSRTAEDETILFVSYEIVTAEDEARIRIAWGNGTRYDEALIRYGTSYSTYGEVTEEDIGILVHHLDNATQDTSIGPILSHSLLLQEPRPVPHAQHPIHATETSSEDRERLKSWYKGIEEDYKDIYAGVRLHSTYAFSTIGGILYRGVLDFLLWPENEFDEPGVLKGGLPYST